MKKTFKFIMALVITSSTLFYSCETTELELINDPNALTTGDPDLLLNSIQLAYASNMATHNNFGSSLTRISYFGGRDYFAGLTGGSINGNWNRLYTNLLINLKEIETIQANNDQLDLRFNIALAKSMAGHSLLLMVDFVGDIPFSEAVNVDEFPDPTLDGGATVYTAAIAMLDDAKALLSSITSDEEANITATDMFYNENIPQWIKMINTVKMKAALTTGDLSTFNAIVADGSFISGPEDDLVLQYGTNLLNPNTQHPDYFNDYTPSGANIYQSNWLMNQMQESDDPRIRYYFYRQVGCTPGASCDPDGSGETISCSLETPPVHYVTGGYTYCFLENGYWGRDHGDDDGTPPDNFTRTASGVYPAGGKLDGDNFANLRPNLNDNGTDEDTSDDFWELVLNTSDDGVGLNQGGSGAGIEPIILSSYVNFMRAEAALSDGNPSAAANFLRQGITESITKVQSFGALDPNGLTGILSADIDPQTADLSNVVLSSSLFPSDNSAFINAQIDAFNTATGDDKWNVLAEQYWVAMYGGAAEAYNFYRRTGYPTTLQPNLEPDPGGFPRSFPYATGAVNANPNIAQKPNQAVQVFWDNNPPSSASGGFPVAN